ncbi:MAG: hypothetical protein RR283_12665 [Comamonas sp.]
MRQAHSLFFPLLATALLGASLTAQAAASSSSSSAAPARPAVFDPSAPTAALQHQALQAGAAIVSQTGDWKAANAAVAEFPRGHADVLKWEKSPAGATGQSADQAMPAHGRHQHGGQP